MRLGAIDAAPVAALLVQLTRFEHLTKLVVSGPAITHKVLTRVRRALGKHVHVVPRGPARTWWTPDGDDDD